jgi:hypothetical protein
MQRRGHYNSPRRGGWCGSTIAGLAVILGLVVFVTATEVALGEGGTSIASAPTMVYAQEEFGNTVNGGTAPWVPGVLVYSSYWLLPAVAGDRIRIDWEAQDPTNNNVWLDVFPVGTNDFNQPSTSPVASQQIGSGTKSELALSAGVTGTMAMRIRLTAPTGTGGPYDFTAYVQHALRLGLSIHSSGRHRSDLVVGVHNPDGALITDRGLTLDFQVQSANGWRDVGRYADTTTPFILRRTWSPGQRGRKFLFRVRAYGHGYLNASSPTIAVKGF